MQDTSFGVVPIRDHAFFKQTVLQGEVSDCFLERAHLVAEILHFARGRLTRCVARKAALASFQELLRPAVVETFGNALPPAQLGDRRLAAQSGKDDPDLLLCRELPPGPRRISFTCFSADCGPEFCLIFACLFGLR
jgi:hypothetical protein